MIEFFVAFLLCFVALQLLINTRLGHLAMDKPNERSMHTGIIPRTGGLAIMLGTLTTALFNDVSYLWLGLSASLVIISLIDDIRGLKVRWRLLAQVIVCVVFLAYNQPGLAIWVTPLALLAMLWMLNLYNFMDGLDGLAAGMAVFGFGAYALTAQLAGAPEIAILSTAIVGASFAFLVFNFNPATIFMGDAGSVPLGFLAAGIGFKGWQDHLWPLWFPILVFSPFIVDATVTLLRRIHSRHKIWQPHKTHYYQRLAQLGWGHRKTVLVFYGLMLAVAATAILVILEDIPVDVLLIWIPIYLSMLLTVDWMWVNKSK